jgi:hypothetical protein
MGARERICAVRDYDAELKALGDKARALKAKKVQQLGELVTSTGADALDLDVLAGALLAAVGSASADEKEAWRAKGAAFFQGSGRKGSSALAMTAKTEMALAQARRRVEAAQLAPIRGDGSWPPRTHRHLIELGGLVQKAGLVELADDDRATLYGALLDLAAKAREDRDRLMLWKRRGARVRRGSGRSDTMNRLDVKHPHPGPRARFHARHAGRRRPMARG